MSRAACGGNTSNATPINMPNPHPLSSSNLRSMKSLNFINKKRNMEKIIQENIMMMKKIHFAQPSVQYEEHKEHERNVKKLRKLVGFNSLRQSMISTVRNYFVRFK